MTDASLLFIGRTGVGKSSLINFLTRSITRDTDPYRPCTKDTAVIHFDYEGDAFDLIDTPGLCESGDDLDETYLKSIDRYIGRNTIFPIFVFKADDTRLRTEDYQLLKKFIGRYGQKLLRDISIVLTFAGNLPIERDHKIITRIKQITLAIYSIQIELGQDAFSGFSRVSVVDCDLGEFFSAPIPSNQFMDDSIDDFVINRNISGIAGGLDIHPEIAEYIANALVDSVGRVPHESKELLKRLRRFPLHNIGQSRPTALSQDSPPMTQDPSSVFEIASRLVEDGCSDNSVSVDNGVLRCRVVSGYRIFSSDQRFADCLTLDALAYKVDSEFHYKIGFKISGHPYDPNGNDDLVELFRLVSESVPCLEFEVKTYKEFLRCIKFHRSIFSMAENRFIESIKRDLANDYIWEEDRMQ